MTTPGYLDSSAVLTSFNTRRKHSINRIKSNELIPPMLHNYTSNFPIVADHKVLADSQLIHGTIMAKFILYAVDICPGDQSVVSFMCFPRNPAPACTLKNAYPVP